MSEEEVTENVEETPEAGENEDSGNPIFDALFKAVEGEEETEQEEEELVAPSSLQSALHDIEQGEEPEAQEDATESVSSEGSEESAEVPDAPKKKRVARKKNIVDPDFKPTATSGPPKAPPPSIPNLGELNDAEKDRYELARWASQNIDGYKGKEQEYLKFFKEHKNYLENRLKEDPDIELDQDEAYRSFLAKNRPHFNADHVKTSKIKIEAEKSAIEKLSPEIQAQKKELQRLKIEPETRKAKQKSRTIVAKSIPQEVMDGFRNDPEFSKTHALEAKIVDRILGEANSMADAFHDIAADLVDYDPNNPIHVRLSQWIDQEQTAFIQSGKTKKQGKTFVRRERFPNVPPSEADKYYTFTDDDIVALLAQRAGHSMKHQIEKNLSDLQAAGFSRQTPKPAKSQASVNKPPTRSPAPSPRPGPSVDSSSSDQSENKVLSLLGL